MKPAFFKVLIDDFDTCLRLPPYFAWKFGELLPKYPVLAMGSENLWHVKIEEVAEHKCFTKGWPKFVKDLRLERHDFLVFWFDAPSKFLVEVYAGNGPEKILSHLTTKGKGSPKRQAGGSGTSEDVHGSGEKKKMKNKKKTSSFSVTMKPSNKYRMTIPAKFLRESGMMGSRCFVLKDQLEREWPVLICLHGGRNPYRGWSEFRAANGLVIGDTCTFTTNCSTTQSENNCEWSVRVQVKRAREAEAAAATAPMSSVAVSPKRGRPRLRPFQAPFTHL